MVGIQNVFDADRGESPHPRSGEIVLRDHDILQAFYFSAAQSPNVPRKNFVAEVVKTYRVSRARVYGARRAVGPTGRANTKAAVEALFHRNPRTPQELGR